MATAITGSVATGVTAGGNRTIGSNALGKDEFLKLLTAQLANQAPLAPTDNQAFIAQLAPGQPPQALASAEGSQAFDGAGHIWPGLVGGRHEPSNGASVAGDRDLLAGIHCIEQGSEMGFGFKRADGSRDGAHGGVSTSCQPVYRGPGRDEQLQGEGLGEGHQGNGVVAASISVRSPASPSAARRDGGDPSAQSPRSPRG